MDKTPYDAPLTALDQRLKNGEELPRHWHLSDRGLCSVRRESYLRCAQDGHPGAGKCPSCAGTGSDSPVRLGICPACSGTGKRYEPEVQALVNAATHSAEYYEMLERATGVEHGVLAELRAALEPFKEKE